MRTIEFIATYSYFCIGVVLSMYWFTKYYEKSYVESLGNEEPKERGMVSFILSMMTILWPIVVVKNIILHRTL